jgi:5-hydroxyisourate hydrolase
MTLSTHVLDISLGGPAAGVDVALYRFDGHSRSEIARGRTNGDGRIAAPFGGELAPGEYELEFGARAYFTGRGARSFYDSIPIRFRLESGAHYHVPLLLSPWGYSTYRGS